MKHEPIVSVVVAVHNMKGHIRQCIDSVLSQSLQELELVLVDDVSTDGTADILREYAEKDKRVILVWQTENGGAQLARNAGIVVSSGRYITTLDHDDFLAYNALACAVDTFRKHEGLQCVCFREIRLLPDGTFLEHEEKNSFNLISGEEAYRRSIGWKGINGRMIVTRELQMQYLFDNCERVYGEDNTAQLQFLASPLVASCQGIYYHRLLDTSLSHKVSLNNIRGNIRFINMKRQLKAHGYGNEILRLNETAFWASIVSSYYYYHRHRLCFSQAEQQEALHLIKYMREQIDTTLLAPSTRWRPGYWKMSSWNLFRLQEEAYFLLRRLIKNDNKALE